MRLLLSILLLTALLGKGMVPAGYMVEDRIGGGIELTLCSSDGAVTVVIGPDGLPVEDSPAKNTEPCPYFMVPSAVVAEVGGLLTIQIGQTVAMDWQENQDQLAVILLLNENAARAPPVTV